MSRCKLIREYPRIESSIEIRHFGCSLIISCKLVIDAILILAYGGVFCPQASEKGIKYSQDQLRIMLLFEHYFRHNAVVLMRGRRSKA